MANRRMFSQDIINKASFIRMPPSARLLYYDLGMKADDDGFVEAFAVMRSTGAAEDDLRVLAAKGFVKVINEDWLTWITDWNENNHIRGDRKHDSIYHDLLVQLSDGTMTVNRCFDISTNRVTMRNEYLPDCDIF